MVLVNMAVCLYTAQKAEILLTRTALTRFSKRTRLRDELLNCRYQNTSAYSWCCHERYEAQHSALGTAQWGLQLRLLFDKFVKEQIIPYYFSYHFCSFSIKYTCTHPHFKVNLDYPYTVNKQRGFNIGNYFKNNREMFALLSKQTGAKRECSFPHFTVLSPPPLTQLPPHLGKKLRSERRGFDFQ
jgi:hypothetical protein